MKAYIPKPGHVWNPLRSLPRNGKCVCGSGKKFKKCCLPYMPSTLTEAQHNALIKKK